MTEQQTWWIQTEVSVDEFNEHVSGCDATVGTDPMYPSAVEVVWTNELQQTIGCMVISTNIADKPRYWIYTEGDSNQPCDPSLRRGAAHWNP